MMSQLKVIFSRCLAEFYLQHAAKSVDVVCIISPAPANDCHLILLQVVAIYILTIPAELLLRHAQGFLYTCHPDL